MFKEKKKWFITLALVCILVLISIPGIAIYQIRQENKSTTFEKKIKKQIKCKWFQVTCLVKIEVKNPVYKKPMLAKILGENSKAKHVFIDGNLLFDATKYCAKQFVALGGEHEFKIWYEGGEEAPELVITNWPFEMPICAAPDDFTQSSNPEIDPETGWKIYRNKKAGYSISFPADFYYEDGPHSFINIPGEIAIIPPSQYPRTFGGTIIAVVPIKFDASEKRRYDLQTKEQFDELYAKAASDRVNDRFYKLGNVNLVGIEAVQFVTQTLAGDQTEPFYSIVTWFQKDRTNYYIELGGDKKIVDELIPIYNQILSTFKFTE